MTTAMMENGVELVGDAAGKVWSALHEKGPMSLSKLPKQVDAPRDVVMMGVGWLAREDKIAIEEVKRQRIVSLIED